MGKCSVFEVNHVLHNPNLGTDALSKGSNNPQHYQSTPHRERWCWINTDELAMLGESAGDQALNDVLKEVLSDQPDNLVATMDLGRMGNMNRIFAALRGVA